MKLITTLYLILSIIGMFMYILQQKQYIEYENEVHNTFCELAEERWASDEYLLTEKCI